MDPPAEQGDRQPRLECGLQGASTMLEGYCVKCKAKKPITEAVEEIMKNGRKAVKGKCPACGAVMFKILGGKAPVSATMSVPAAVTAESGEALPESAA